MLEITISIQGFWPGGTDKTWRTAGLTGSANLISSSLMVFYIILDSFLD